MTLANDLRYGVRALRKSPGFALTAVITMALGMGATTAIFSVCDAMLWKPVPVPHLETLVTILERNPENPHDFGSLAPADVRDIEGQAASVGPFAIWQQGLANIAGPGGEPERVTQYLVSTNFFDVIGVLPAIGQAFREGQNEPGNERVVLLSDALWKRRYGGEASIIGQKIRLDDEDYIVIGVAPPKFAFPKAAELWTPYAWSPADRANRRARNCFAAARLKPGRTVPEFVAELEGIGARLAAQYPETNRIRRFMAWDAHRFLVGDFNRLYSQMLLYSVLFVLLIACVNVANLQFARATGRMREVALRTALGASRGQIVAQLVTESVLLSLAGAVLGLAVAEWGLELIRSGMPPEVERYVVGWREIALDARAMLFTFLAALVSGLLAGLFPAWQSSRPNLALALRDGARTSSGRGRRRARGILVAAEVALAVVLLIGASLMARGFGTMVASATRLEPSTVLTFRVALTATKYAKSYQRLDFYNQLLQRTAAIPGVKRAAAASFVPYADHSNGAGYLIDGRPDDPARPVEAGYQAIVGDYFSLLHIPLRAGRFFDSHDGPYAPHVAVITERMARRYWPDDPLPIGRKIRVKNEKDVQWMTIVGIAGDILYDTLERGPRPILYFPYQQSPTLWMDFALRTNGDPNRYAAAAIAAVRATDPEQPVNEIRSLDVLIHDQALGIIYVAVLMAVFGALALVLACVGVYGVMSYLVQEQTHEIGIRMALGAPRDLVMRMVFRRGMLTTLLGLATGLAFSAVLARLLQDLIWGVPAHDAVTFFGIPLALVAAAALAIFIPARRATRIDPVIALRYD